MTDSEDDASEFPEFDRLIGELKPLVQARQNVLEQTGIDIEIDPESGMDERFGIFADVLLRLGSMLQASRNLGKTDMAGELELTFGYIRVACEQVHILNRDDEPDDETGQ